MSRLAFISGLSEYGISYLKEQSIGKFNHIHEPASLVEPSLHSHLALLRF